MAILVSSIVLGGATMILGGIAAVNGTNDRQSQAQDKARTTIDTLASQLRNAIGPAGQSPIYYPAAGSSGGASEVVFYNPGGSPNASTNPRGLQWIRYCLDYTTPANETLWVQRSAYDTSQTTPPSTAACPSSAWASQAPVATNIVNQECGTTLFTQSTDAAGAIHDIQVRLLVRLSAGNCTRQPQQKGDQYPTAITSSINFRNAKTGPTAVISCQVQNKHAVCDASKSSDPDGEAVSFKWKYLCCSPGFAGGDSTWEAGQTSYLFDKGPLTAGVYAIYVQATDASGLASTANQNVTIP